jgi:hypothetical protein
MREQPGIEGVRVHLVPGRDRQLRHPLPAVRLERLISRTLAYGLLTVLLAGVYASVVLVLGQLFGGGVGGIRRAGRWLARPWPSRRSFSRLAGASRR